MEQEKLTLTILEASRLLGIGKSKGYQLAREGLLPTLRFGKRLVVSKYGLERMLQEAGNHLKQVDKDEQ